MKKFFVLDAVNFLFRSYYAISPMTNSEGLSTNALYGFIRSVFKIISTFSPDYLVAVFDGPDNKKSRTDIYEDYKSHRTKMPEDLFSQWERAVEFCQMAGLAHLSIPEVEADDVIGSIAKWTETQSLQTFICTSDKDLCQLVSDSTFLIHAHKNNLLVDKEKVQEMFSVTPSQIVDYLSLTGDTSDNIPGIEGIGPKTASTLLQQFSSLEKILAYADSIPGKKGELIRKGKESARLSQKLALLNVKVPIPMGLNFYELKAANSEKLKTFYHQNNFLSLLKEVQTTEPTEVEPSALNIISSPQDLSNLLHILRQQTSICFDIAATQARPMQTSLIGIALGVDSQKSWYIPLNKDLPKTAVLDFLKELFSDPKIRFFGHNIKHALHVFSNENLPLPQIDFDTLIGSYLLAPHSSKHDLEALCAESFQVTKTSKETLLGRGKKQLSIENVPYEAVGLYCTENISYIYRLKKLFLSELKEANLLPLLNDLELPLIFVLLQMERNGIFLDAPKIEKLSQELTKNLASLSTQIHELAKEPFNINSPKQLASILFEKMQIPPPKKTKTGFSTAADVLESLQDKSPIIPLILEFRQLEKLRSTYVDSLPLDVNPSTHRIHCSFNQSVAATGRLSCQNPNLQNIPVRSIEGKKIREAFRPEKPGWSYLSADYSQIELRLLAHLSEDPILIRAFQSGEDIHAATASLIFETPLDKVSKEMRYRAKAVNFGILYGQQAFGLSKELGIDFREAALFIETYFQKHPKVKGYIESCKKSAESEGAAYTMLGRRRPIPEIHSKNPALKSFAERLAVNTPLQGSAADLIKLSMVKIHPLLQSKKSLCILQIHDELLFEVPEEEISELSSLVQEHMENAFSLKVPLVVDISVGKNWKEC